MGVLEFLLLTRPTGILFFVTVGKTSLGRGVPGILVKWLQAAKVTTKAQLKMKGALINQSNGRSKKAVGLIVAEE